MLGADLVWGQGAGLARNIEHVDVTCGLESTRLAGQSDCVCASVPPSVSLNGIYCITFHILKVNYYSLTRKKVMRQVNKLGKQIRHINF